MALEKSLQTLIERHLEALLGVRFLASEYGTGKKHGGRIDTLGIDENGSPVIIEYKRHQNENVINQGLYYLDWLLDRQAEFQLLVMDKLGADVAKTIDGSSPRLVWIARYGEELLMLDLVNRTEASTTGTSPSPTNHKGVNPTVREMLEGMGVELTDVWVASIRAFEDN